ncbi:fatty acid desaturase [Thalassobaculum litoreum]|uniref:Fatty acid desaturase n=1 Tax=Thalassobaculum litoreum DSM 18839 TaxID=1123362 RepID=A0A8G2EWV2_9PROT|nr:fatty acid desaturase [Thalassobaculum litoreum]SDG44167.1 Fatty acid desaturase [Thalassobaculum litoreum DSM 18839]
MDQVHRVAADGTGHGPAVAPLPVAAHRRRVRLPDRVEWPTVWVALCVYLPMAAALGVVSAGWIPWWTATPVLAWCAAWQASLQHEVIHGHPTPWARVNRLIAGPPLLGFVPFDRYRDSHLAHHIDERLTDPLDDPESWYVTAARWQRAGRVERVLRLAMNSLAGRVVLGPLWVAALSLVTDGRDLLAGRRLFALAGHAAQLAAMVACLSVVGIPLWGYALLVAWPATGLMLVRSFAEHRPDPIPAQRSVIVEAGGAFDLLFLSNNLHALHHERPGLPWYLLRRVFRDGRGGILARNGGYSFDSYAKMAGRYLFTPRDHPIHPRCR